MRFYFPNRVRYLHGCHGSKMQNFMCTSSHLWPRRCFGLTCRCHPPTRMMGKHFSDSELDSMHKWGAAGISPIEIHKRLQKARACVRKGGPHLSTAWRALKGNTFKRSRVETVQVNAWPWRTPSSGEHSTSVSSAESAAE